MRQLKAQDGVSHSDGVTKANILNDQFSIIFNKNKDINFIPFKVTIAHRTMPEILISTEGTTKLLRN